MKGELTPTDSGQYQNMRRIHGQITSMFLFGLAILTPSLSLANQTLYCDGVLDLSEWDLPSAVQISYKLNLKEQSSGIHAVHSQHHSARGIFGANSTSAYTSCNDSLLLDETGGNFELRVVDLKTGKNVGSQIGDLRAQDTIYAEPISENFFSTQCPKMPTDSRFRSDTLWADIYFPDHEEWYRRMIRINAIRPEITYDVTSKDDKANFTHLSFKNIGDFCEIDIKIDAMERGYNHRIRKSGNLGIVRFPWKKESN